MAEQKALYIDGNWVTTPNTVVNTNPSDINDVIGEYAQASSGHVDDALAAANLAVGEWGVCTMETRYQVRMGIGYGVIGGSSGVGE